MVALKTGDTEQFIAAPNSRFPVILVYGKDAGLVSERVEALASAFALGSTDPFGRIRLDGDDIASEPTRLAEEANTIGLFGGRRIIRVRVGQKSLAPSLEPLLRTPPTDAVVILEAGDLSKSAPLRATVERSKDALAIACYLDDARSVERLVDDEMRRAKLRINPDAKSALVILLGADRLTTRSELTKLIIYAGHDEVITLAHVEAACGDASDTPFDMVVDAAFAGNWQEILRFYPKLLAEGATPDMLLRAAMNHALALARMLAELNAGRSLDIIVTTRVPYFKRRPIVRSQLTILNSENVAAASSLLWEAVYLARKNPRIAEAAAERALLSLRSFVGKSRNAAP